MLRIHFLLRQPKKSGVKAIYATVRYNGQTVILYPKISIHTNDWINKNGINKPKPIPENQDLKNKLHDYENLILDTYKDLQLKSPKKVISGDILKKSVYAKWLMGIVEKQTKVAEVRILITDFFQTMINDSNSGKRKSLEGKQLTASTISTYETTKKHFEDYQTKERRKYYLSGIDQKLTDGFSDYLIHHLKMAFNGSGKYMKTFKTMMGYARQLKMIGADVLIDTKVKVTHETPDNIYLSMKDIKDMWALESFDSPVYELTRDLFVTGCLTGLRFSDYSTLSKARIDNGFIYITQQKTKGRVTIPIHSIVKQILAKYPDGLPTAPPNQVFNRYLKVIGKKLPQLDTDFEKVLTREGVPDPKTYKKYEILTSHCSRRSFATNEYLNGTPTITIMAITGHRSEKSFMAYIKADSLQHAMLLADRWRGFEKSHGKQKNDNSRINTLNSIANVLQSIGRQPVVFNKDVIANDRRLYLLYNLTDDKVMREVVIGILDEFENWLSLKGAENETEVVKLDMFMTVFHERVKDGSVNAAYLQKMK